MSCLVVKQNPYRIGLMGFTAQKCLYTFRFQFLETALTNIKALNSVTSQYASKLERVLESYETELVDIGIFSGIFIVITVLPRPTLYRGHFF